MPVHFIITIAAYLIFFAIVGVAYLSHLIETSEEYREKWGPSRFETMLIWILLSLWPLLGIPVALNANEDKHIDGIETMFIILELMFWVPMLIYFIQMWLG